MFVRKTTSYHKSLKKIKQHDWHESYVYFVIIINYHGTIKCMTSFMWKYHIWGCAGTSHLLFELEEEEFEFVPYCPRLPTAAPRGSLGCVSIPVWLIVWKDQLTLLTPPYQPISCSFWKHAQERKRSPFESPSFEVSHWLSSNLFLIMIRKRRLRRPRAILTF